MPGLRVAVDVTPLLGLRTGVAQCVSHLLDALPEAAPDITVVPYVLSRRARRRSLPAGTRALAVPAGLAIRAWGFVDRPTLARSFRDVDVVHGTNFVVPPSGRPSTVTVHDCWCLRHPEECEPAVQPFHRAVRRAVRRGAWVHVSTATLEAEVRSLYPTTRTAVVPFGVPSMVAPGELPPGVVGPYILTISTLEPRKRHEHLVRAFGAVAAGDPRLRLVLAGADGPASDAVAHAIEDLPPDVARRVLRVGRVDEPTRSALLRGASVLAYPSADEGFGFPVLEAMSVDVPVVTSNVGGLREVAGDAAVLVPVHDDPAVLADALTRALGDRQLRETLRARGRLRVQQLSWSAHAAGMAELWRRAAEAA